MGDGDRELTDLRFVGPATAAVLRDAGVTADDIEARQVAHEELLEAGVNPGVAARIRREHSLAWSHTAGGDLSRRADQVAGLAEAERAWVAASDGDWEQTQESQAGGRTEAEEWRRRESEWQERPRPDPVTSLEAVTDAEATRLADAGITSVRSLARADATQVARSLDLDEERVSAWKRAARSHRD